MPDKIKILYRTWDGSFREERKLADIPELGDEVEFEDGKVYRVTARTWLKNVLTGERVCDIYLDNWTLAEIPEAIHA